MTLVEFMVGITIGLLVTMAAVGSLIMTRSAARTLNDSTGLEQQATLVMMQIGQQVSQAGAVTARNSTVNNILPYITFNVDALGGGVNAGNPRVSIFGSIDTVADAANHMPDRFSISYPAPNDDGGRARNCIGNTPTGAAGSQIIISQFSLNGTSLRCGDSVSTQPIAGNVADMRVLYLQADGGGRVTYTNTDDTTAPPNWAQVVGVQICLELQGDPTEAPGQSFKDCHDQNRTLADGRVHRIVRQTFYLRNTS
jgi:type IV pilus assembly protein PilW